MKKLLSLILVLVLCLIAVPSFSADSVYIMDNTGTPTGVRSVDNRLETVTMERGLAVAKGLIAGQRGITIPGHKAAVSSALLDDLTEIPSTNVAPTPGGIQLEVVSSSTADDAGVYQVETATITGTITSAGNITITLTSALTVGSPLAVPVAVLVDDTATIMAGKIRTALNATPAVALDYTASGTGADVILTANVEAANDATLNIASATGTAAGLTPSATSANTVAGVANGTGIIEVDIYYLDSNGVEQEERVRMAGQTPVATVATDIDFVQWSHTYRVGTNGVAVGNISIRHTSDTPTYEYIAAGGNQSLSGRYKIPTGYTGYVTGWQCSGFAQKMDIRLRATVERWPRNTISNVFLFQDIAVLLNAASGYRPFGVPLSIPAGTVVKMSAIAAAGVDGDASGSFDVTLIPDQQPLQ